MQCINYHLLSLTHDHNTKRGQMFRARCGTLQRELDPKMWVKIRDTDAQIYVASLKELFLTRSGPQQHPLKQHSSSDPLYSGLLTRCNTLVVSFHSIFMSVFIPVTVTLGTQ